MCDVPDGGPEFLGESQAIREALEFILVDNPGSYHPDEAHSTNILLGNSGPTVLDIKGLWFAYDQNQDTLTISPCPTLISGHQEEHRRMVFRAFCVLEKAFKAMHQPSHFAYSVHNSYLDDALAISRASELPTLVTNLKAVRAFVLGLISD